MDKKNEIPKEQFISAHFILSDDCNLRCPYCFVDHKNNLMSRETAKAGVDFLFNGALKSNKDFIVITFFIKALSSVLSLFIS